MVKICFSSMRIYAPDFSITSIGDIFEPSFDMLCKWLKDRSTVKLEIFPVISRRNDK